MAYQTPFFLRTRSIALILVTSAMSASAFAQWQWIDNTGRKVFSDTAPPPGIPDKNILKQPNGQPPLRASSTPDAASQEDTLAEKPLAPKSSGSDPKLEAQRKKIEAAELAQRKAERERIAKIRAEHCAQAKKAQATLDSGLRIATLNDKGEREILDDKARAAERGRLAGVVESECAPLPQPVE